MNTRKALDVKALAEDILLEIEEEKQKHLEEIRKLDARARGVVELFERISDGIREQATDDSSPDVGPREPSQASAS